MDNRLKFLYCVITELWGRMWKVEPGNGIPGQAKELVDRQIRPSRQKRDAYRIKVGKSMSHVPRKAAIVYYVPVP